MLQPVNLQLAHYNVEHSAQISKDAIAAAQQTGQGKVVVEESVKRMQMVQAGLAAAEVRKVKHKEEGEERERRREGQRQAFSERRPPGRGEGESEAHEIGSKTKAAKKFDFYA
ncbi:MAG: hypothetical protein LBC93_01500 [Synergistaceae bacterium]|jgi:hypothetical protein|nr:hypothetical protein [Synergistaceae bacterium]